MPPFLRPPYLYVFAGIYAVWAVPEFIDAVRRTDRGGDDYDANSKYVLYGVFGVAVFVAIELGVFAPTWASFGQFAVPLFWIGVVVLLCGVALRWYTVRVLGECFSRSVRVTEGQEVVENGPYALVRHPTYTAGVLSSLGLGLLLGTWPGLVIVLLATIGGYAYRIRVEERVLRRELDGYADYCERTPYRLAPGLY